jgi:hypothetical protein
MTTNYTYAARRNARRRLDYRSPAQQQLEIDTQAVLTKMRGGMTLHCTFRTGRVIWWVSSGIFIDNTTAKAVLADAHVRPADDVLFPNMGLTAQTYTYVTE